MSRQTVTRRTVDLAGVSKEQLKSEAEKFEYFSFGLDESTDISDISQLLIFVRGVYTDFTITEELVGIRPVTSTTTRTVIAGETIKGLEKIGLGGAWEKLSGVTTDGVSAMIGTREYAKEQVEVGMDGVSTTEAHEIMRYHCIIHQEALCPKAIGFEDVMSAVIKDVNFIRSHALNHREFKIVLDV